MMKVIFDNTCANWDEDVEFNKVYLKGKENYWNGILHTRGYVFLRNILEDIGIRVNSYSITSGWSMDDKDTLINFSLQALEDGSIVITFNENEHIKEYFK